MLKYTFLQLQWLYMYLCLNFLLRTDFTRFSCSNVVFKQMSSTGKKQNFMSPFYGRGSTATRLQSHFEEAVYFLGGHPPLYVTFSVCPSVRRTHHISETVHHRDFCYTSVKWYLQAFFIFIFKFRAVKGLKGQKKSPKWKIKITSVTCHFSGTV